MILFIFTFATLVLGAYTESTDRIVELCINTQGCIVLHESCLRTCRSSMSTIQNDDKLVYVAFPDSQLKEFGEIMGNNSSVHNNAKSRTRRLSPREESESPLFRGLSKLPKDKVELEVGQMESTTENIVRTYRMGDSNSHTGKGVSRREPRYVDTKDSISTKNFTGTSESVVDGNAWNVTAADSTEEPSETKVSRTEISSPLFESTDKLSNSYIKSNDTKDEEEEVGNLREILSRNSRPFGFTQTADEGTYEGTYERTYGVEDETIYINDDDTFTIGRYTYDKYCQPIPEKTIQFYPHPKNCTSFFVYDHNNGLVEETPCGPATVWDNDRRLCNIPKMVNMFCDASIDCSGETVANYIDV